MADSSRPLHPIRRFDVFAEFNRIQYQERGMNAPQAKGRAIWTAKVVAGRGGRGGPAPKSTGDGKKSGGKERHDEPEESEFRSLGDELQTDQTFDREIVDRMGHDFYHQVFRPAVEQAHGEGKQYADIRDSIRKDWK